MPSNTYDNLTLGANGTIYTAPANGWVAVKGLVAIWVASYDVSNNEIIYSWAAQGGIHIPVTKGQKFVISYGSGTTPTAQFIYAQGSESEAS